MSLLMDALKKAEKAKQGPNSVFGDPPPTSPPAGGGPPTVWPELSIDPKPAELDAEVGLSPPPPKPAPPPAEKAARPLALDPLPAPPAIDEPPPPPSRVSEPEPAPAPRAPAAVEKPTASATSESADRLAAKRVFTAKQAGPATNPRMPFYAALAVLLLAGVGGAFYVWTESQGPPGLAGKVPAPTATGPISAAPVAPAPQAAADSRPPASMPAAGAAPVSGAAPASATQPASAPAGPAPVIAAVPEGGTAAARPPVLPATSVSPTLPVTTAQSAAVRSTPADPQVRREEAAPTVNPPAVAAMQAGRNGVSARGGTPVNTPSNLRITRDRPGPGVDPAVSAGYAALSEGNLDAAREHYNRALEADNTNRDALLGLAAIASRTGRRDVAENMYRRVLELQPRDPYATAQLTALHNSADTASAESRVKSLLANEREPASAAPLQFALGNQMAAQGRWAEAQQAYFTAYSAESDNPDYCYNLAVSLDQLHQARLAQDFYAKAIALSSTRRAGFDLARAKARLEQLASTAK